MTFLEGFADETGSTLNEAEWSWAAWSRQLGGNERAQIEAQGYRAGRAEGSLYCSAFGASRNECIEANN